MTRKKTPSIFSLLAILEEVCKEIDLVSHIPPEKAAEAEAATRDILGRIRAGIPIARDDGAGAHSDEPIRGKAYATLYTPSYYKKRSMLYASKKRLVVYLFKKTVSAKGQERVYHLKRFSILLSCIRHYEWDNKQKKMRFCLKDCDIEQWAIDSVWDAARPFFNSEQRSLSNHGR